MNRFIELDDCVIDAGYVRGMAKYDEYYDIVVDGQTLTVRAGEKTDKFYNMLKNGGNSVGFHRFGDSLIRLSDISGVSIYPGGASIYTYEGEYKYDDSDVVRLFE